MNSTKKAKITKFVIRLQAIWECPTCKVIQNTAIPINHQIVKDISEEQCYHCGELITLSFREQTESEQKSLESTPPENDLPF